MELYKQISISMWLQSILIAPQELCPSKNQNRSWPPKLFYSPNPQSRTNNGKHTNNEVPLQLGLLAARPDSFRLLNFGQRNLLRCPPPKLFCSLVTLPSNLPIVSVNEKTYEIRFFNLRPRNPLSF